jgi:hypothetical protein
MPAGRWQTSTMVARYTARQGARSSAAARIADRGVPGAVLTVGSVAGCRKSPRMTVFALPPLPSLIGILVLAAAMVATIYLSRH